MDATFFHRSLECTLPDETIDELLPEDFVITNAGHAIGSKDNFRKWASGPASQFKDLKVEIKKMIVADNGSESSLGWWPAGGTTETSAPKQATPRFR